MLRHIIRRVPAAVLTLWLASILIFVLEHVLPGDPAAQLLGTNASRAAIRAVDHRLGLDRPFVLQYVDWLRGLLTGHLGTSYLTSRPIGALIGKGAVATLELAASSLLLSIVIGFALGVVLATSHRRFVRSSLAALETAMFSVPEYVLAVILLLVFAVGLGWLPVGGRASFATEPDIAVQYLAMPAVALSLHTAAVFSRFVKSSLSAELGKEYIDTAVSDGLSRTRVVLRHALPNALPQVITIVGIRVGHILGGAVVIEAIFQWQGLGQLLASSVQNRDYPVLGDLVLLAVATFIVVQIVTDLLHATLDPRVKLGAG